MKHLKTNSSIKINFFRSEISVGICIFFAIFLSLLVNNSSASSYYFKFFSSLVFSFANQKFVIIDFINNIFLLLFFLLITIELKKEFLVGELSFSKRIVFSVFASSGSILGAIIVFYIAKHNEISNIEGFLTSCLTDGALLYCFVKLCKKFFNNKIISIVLTITSVNNAIFVILISTFYNNAEYVYLFLLASILSCFFIFKYCNFYNIYVYIFTAIVLWFVLWLCNIPQVLAGVVLGIFIPFKYHHKAVSIKIGKQISPIVNFFILPVFIFANSGLDFSHFKIHYLLESMITSVFFSIVIGKQLGFLLFVLVIYKLNITKLPNQIGWSRVYCLAIFNSVSLTHGLFLNYMLFKEDVALLNQTKLALILGNLCVILFGFILTVICNKADGWGGRIRTYGWRYQKPLPYRLATPQKKH